jgi:uncharacterized membrane protein YagU involved in acid resistance
MNKDAKRLLAFIIVGFVAAFVSVGIDLSLRPENGDPTLTLIALILISVAALGYVGTYLAEMMGISIEAEGGRPKLYLHTLYYYLITWFVIYVLLYNEFVYLG